MFADFPSRMLSGPHCQRSPFSSVQGKNRPRQQFWTRIGSTLSPEEHPAPAGSAYRRTTKITRSTLSSTKMRVFLLLSRGGRRGDLPITTSRSRTSQTRSQPSTFVLLIKYFTFVAGGWFPYRRVAVPTLIAPIFSIAFWERKFVSPTKNTTFSTNWNACASSRSFISRLYRPPQYFRVRNVHPISISDFSGSYP